MFRTPQHWENTGLTTQLLRPLSFIYKGLRHFHRQYRLHNCYYAGVPVISIGNITAGGAGKTPFIKHLAEHYAQNGYQVAILSRGYGGSLKGPICLNPNTTAAEAGDEPVMLYQKLAHLPVHIWVGKDRKILAQRAELAGATLILLDDGFQRDDIARNIDIVIINGHSPFGNGYCLPAGPLREPLKALSRADFAVVINPPKNDNRYYHLPAYRLQTQWPQEAIKPLKNKKIIAFSGLGNPQKFFTQLHDENLDVQAEIPFPDHHTYTEKELTDLLKKSKENNAILVTTEKDIVRIPTQKAKNITAIPLFLSGSDWENIFTEIDKRLR